MAAIAATLLSAVPALAQTITNTATLSWQAGGATVARQSNRVDLLVERPAATVSLTPYRLTGAPNAQRLAVPETLCRANGVDTPVALDGVYAGTQLNSASVEIATGIRAGDPLVLGIASAADNKDSSAVDTLTINLTTSGGDTETVTLRETGANTGQFVGIIETKPVPPTAVAGDCRLSLRPGETISLGSVRTSDGQPIATAPLQVLVDPYGVVFDSGDASPVAGSRVTLVDADTGAPATVFGDDGVASFPSSLVVGTTVTDSAGVSYAFPAGEYRFPFVRPGRYRLVVETPSPYTVPSNSTPAELTALRRPDGLPFALTDASYGAVFTLSEPEPVRIDIPADRPGAALIVKKTASAAVAVPGDAVQYRVTVTNADAARATGAITVTDRLPDAMRLKPNSVRYNGNIQTYSVSADGHDLSIALPALPAKGAGVLTYLLEVRPDAQAGEAMNRAQARDDHGTSSAVADAAVRIARDDLADRMTIIGRITDGGCAVDPAQAHGVPNVRVMLEDGSYAVTDPDGRYHFEGVLPGTHVVQIDPSTLGPALVPADCARNARSGGSAISRFVEGTGGSLQRVDFRAQAGVNPVLAGAAPGAPRPVPASDAAAAGADRDWFAGQAPGIAWLFPEADHNPRAKAIRVAIKHLPTQSVALFVDGKPANALSFEGARKSPDGQVAVSLWRALDIGDRDTHLTAEVRDAAGAVVERLARTVHFSASPLHAELLRDRSVLVADGVTRPVIAVRLTDRDGRPVHHGLVGDFSVPAPYYPAVEADAQAARGLAGLERGKPVWHVQGDDGVAYIELEPTTASGALQLTLPFRDGEVARSQRIDAWLSPGNRPWTLVGFAAGTAGFNTLKGNLEGVGADGDHWLTDGRIALYAKGRVRGQWLMTLAYDSDKHEDETRFAGVIDPQAYYTIYADRSERRYDAASIRKLYVRLERPQFYALFGDYDTGLTEPQLTRYVRAFNGVKAQYQGRHVGATAFAADTPYTHRREEIQGSGLSGPYGLSARDILPNSETVTIETRDRLRSDRVIETKTLTRNIDYDIDYTAGTLRFRDPVLSRSSLLDPQIIVVDYEVNGIAQRVLNAGGRATWTNTQHTLTVGASAIHDESDVAATNLGGVDVKYTPNTATEVRAEFAASDAQARGGATTAAGTAIAWLVEAEHHGPKYDLLAYAREQENGFGVGQTSFAETGTRKFGFDGRWRFSPALSLIGSAWSEDYLGTGANRQAGQARVEYRTHGLDLRAGLTIANDRLADGRTAESTIAQLGATKRLLNNRLEVDGQTEFALSDRDESVDFPARHRLTARFAVTPDIALVGSYEIAKGNTVDARTARIGFDVKPWAGARLVASANRQDLGEYGPRSFAAYGLSQSLPLGSRWSVDATLDGNKTLHGIDPSRVLNSAQPVASGGYIGTDGTVTEDFTAITGGATYRGDRWSWTGRAEMRTGSLSDRYGVTSSILRRLGEGRALGATASWFRTSAATGVRTESANLAVSWANRPDSSRWSWLEKFELRSDKVSGAVAGQQDAIGSTLLVTGNALSQRIINSLSVNWSPVAESEGRHLGRSEVNLFWGSRYVFDRYDSDTLKGWSNLIGAGVRFDLSETIDIGAQGTIRESAGGRAYQYSGGPALGISPAHNSYITVGYNVSGFHDRDYADARYTRSGPYVTLRLKFDQGTLAGLGLARR